VWLTPRALRLHAVILIVVPGFMALCVWQIYRAVGGNELSWAYVFEWPFFAGYAIYMWWRFVHEAPEPTPVTATPPTTREKLAAPSVPDDSGAVAPATPEERGDRGSRGERDQRQEAEDAELAAYNEYLAQLAERDKAAGR
jgi:hypothetical protein